jgi:nitric oxide reductase large subunit
MKYQTQKVAMLYFYGALTLFLAQVAFGVLAGAIYVLPNTLSVLLPFNIVRMIHTNALIVWSLIGFMGATYFLLPGSRAFPSVTSRNLKAARPTPRSCCCAEYRTRWVCNWRI